MTGAVRADGPGLAPALERAVLIAIALAALLAPLNSTMITVALPQIIEEFSASVTTAGWLVIAYLITMASLQPVGGKLGDRLGRRWLILGGLTYFAAASLGAAFAPSMEWLLAFRVQQGIAGAILAPNGVALVREIVPASRRAGRMGAIGAAIGLAAAAGPPLGGALAALIGWRAIFVVNFVPILPALVLGFWALPSSVSRVASGLGRQVRTSSNSAGRPFDAIGAALLLVTLGGTAGLLSQSRMAEPPVPLAVGAPSLAIIVGALLWRELRHPDPVFQPRFFRLRSFAAANGAIALSNLAMYSTLLTVPLLLAARSNASTIETGLILGALTVGMLLFAQPGGRLADRFGRRRPVVAGLAIFSLGVLPLALGGSEISLPALVVALAVAGVSLGLSSAGLQTSAVEAVLPEQAGSASGVYSTSRYFGSIVGSSVLAAVLGSGAGSTSGFGVIFLMVVIAAFLSMGLALGLRGRTAAQPTPA